MSTNTIIYTLFCTWHPPTGTIHNYLHAIVNIENLQKKQYLFGFAASSQNTNIYMLLCIEYLHHLCHLHHLYQNLTINLVKHIVSQLNLTKHHYLHAFLHIAEHVTKQYYLLALVLRRLLTRTKMHIFCPPCATSHSAIAAHHFQMIGFPRSVG